MITAGLADECLERQPFGMITAVPPACRTVEMPFVEARDGASACPAVIMLIAAPAQSFVRTGARRRPQRVPSRWPERSTRSTLHLVSDTSTLGLRSHSVWTRAQALEVLGRGQVDALVRSRTWQVPWRGVYADGGHDLDAEQRAWAAVLAVGGARLDAAASGRTAARLWGLPLIDDLDPATGHQEHLLEDVAVTRRLPTQHRAGRSLRPTRTRLVRSDLVRLPSGLPVVSPLRALVDCAGLIAPDALVCAVDAALHRGLVTRQDLDAAVRARAGRAHGLALAAAVASADGRAESPPETLARLLLQPSLPGLEPQVELFDETARLLARFDLGDQEVRLAVECDGKAAHAGAAMVAKDRRRDRRTEAYGWRTERVTWFELRRERAAVLRRITDVHAARARHLGLSA